MDPGGETGPRVEALDGAVGAEERFLDDVVRVGGVGGDAVRGAVNGARVPLDEKAEGLIVSAADSRNQLVIRFHPTSLDRDVAKWLVSSNTHPRTHANPPILRSLSLAPLLDRQRRDLHRP